MTDRHSSAPGSWQGRASLGGAVAGCLRTVRQRLPEVCALLLVVQLVVEPIRALRDVPDTDYAAFATGARLLARAACLYCPASQLSAQHGLVGGADPAAFQRFVNLPPAALALVPLDGLPLAAGLAIFISLLMACLAGAGVLAVRLLGRTGTLRDRSVPAVLALASAPAAWGVALGQWDPIVVLAELGAMALAERRRPVAAGLLASVGLVKPQLVWLVPAALVAARAWRLLAGFAAGALLWLVASLLLAGRELADLVPLLRTNDVGAAGHPLAVSLVLALGAVVALALWRGRLRPDLVLAIAAGCGLSLLCSPHLHSDDFLLLAPPLLIVARRWPAVAVGEAIALSAAYILDQALTAHGAQAEIAVAVAVVATAFATAHGRVAGGEPRVHSSAWPDEAFPVVASP